ncbi:unnamed protein product [Adineta ricciae]|uniref:Uncharacterized protein n=1 Tax=Adineta ricciae TaxID=249248 RepID=A0A816CVY0_ADIRI|nr:unnamed protein product [Adineta ricciae]CAF1628879.1 unnamed protein product [Adineta ricciae]
MTRQCWLLTIAFLICIGITLSAAKPRLLIVSLDGFRHEYLSQYSFPTLNRIQEQGVKTRHGMQPTFVTMTYPNHISIATGMYEEDHGIVHNRFFDTKLQKAITFGTGDEGQWSDPKVEPLWITATKQNKKAAVIHWPACHNEFHGIRPLAYTKVYSDAVPFREKIDQAIDYFKNSSFDLAMIYHFEPDKQGHVYGPDSIETYTAIMRLDSDLNYLLIRVNKELDDDLNIMIVSDHGMANTTRIVQPFLEGYINQTAVETNMLDGPIFVLTPRPGYFNEVFNGLRRIPNVTVYKREDFPEKYHYAKASHRLGDIIVIPNGSDTMFSRALTTVVPSKGNHGYDNSIPSMQAIFMAMGPDFQQHLTIDSLKNGDIYQIACHILNLVPNPYATAGSLKNLTHIFRERNNQSSQLLINVSLIILLVLFTFIQ